MSVGGNWIGKLVLAQSCCILKISPTYLSIIVSCLVSSNERQLVFQIFLLCSFANQDANI